MPNPPAGYDPDKDPLVKYAAIKGGHLKPIFRKHGEKPSYLYTWSIDGKPHWKYFNVHIDSRIIREFIRKTQEEIAYQKAGLVAEFKQIKATTQRTSAEKLLRWFSETYLAERVPSNHPQYDIRMSSVRHTLDNYFRGMRHLIAWLAEEKHNAEYPVELLTREDIQAWKMKMLKENLQPVTVNAYMKFARIVFRRAEQEGQIPQSPFTGVRSVEENKIENKTTLSITEMKIIADVLEEKMGQAFNVTLYRSAFLMWTISRFTAMRGSDVARLKWSDLDFENAIVKITMAKPKLKVIERPLHRGLVRILREFRAKHPAAESSKVIVAKLKAVQNVIHLEIMRRFGKTYRVGTHTPRRSLSTILHNEYGWTVDEVRYVLGHTQRTIADLYVKRELESYRKKINAVPLEG